MNIKGLVVLDTKGNRYILVPENTPANLPATEVPETEHSPDLIFGLKLRGLREGARITQVALAKEARTKQPVISDWETGKRSAREVTQIRIIEAWETLSRKKWK